MNNEDKDNLSVQREINAPNATYNPSFSILFPLFDNC